MVDTLVFMLDMASYPTLNLLFRLWSSDYLIFSAISLGLSIMTNFETESSSSKFLFHSSNFSSSR